MEAVIVATLSVALAVPALGAEANVVDLKAVETQVVAAQGQIVAGNLDAGLKAIHEIQAKAVTADLQARVAFVAKLAEVRMAEKVGDQAKTLAALTEAFAQAKQPDQVQATWAVGLAVAQATVAGNGNAAPVIDFLAKGPGPAVKQFAANVELARLRIATGNVGVAEAELRNAAQRANSTQEWSTWVDAVTQLATAVDGGQAPQAGADVFARMHDAAKATGAQVMIDIARGRFLLSRGQLDAVSSVVGSVIGSGDSTQATAILSLGYDLTVAFNRAGKADQAKQILAQTEKFAQSLPVGAAVATARCQGLLSAGMADQAADVVWKAAQVAKTPVERDQLLTAFGNAMVAAGQVPAITPKLQTMKAPASVYVSVAGALVNAGNSTVALAILGNVPPAAFADDVQGSAAVGPLMQQIQTQRQQIAKDQGVRVRAIATALDAAAKASKDPKAAGTLAKQAAAMTALAGQVEK
jgi:hypothetical protein